MYLFANKNKHIEIKPLLYLCYLTIITISMNKFNKKNSKFLSHFTIINFSVIKLVLVNNFLICADHMLPIKSYHKIKYKFILHNIMTIKIIYYLNTKINKAIYVHLQPF